MTVTASDELGYTEKRAQHRAWLRSRTVYQFGMREGSLLDAGCGDGFWGDLFAELGFVVTGVDLNADAIAEGRIRYPRLELHQGDVLQGWGDEHDEHYDWVYARTLPAFYQATLEPATEMIDALVKRLKPAGALVVCVYSDQSGQVKDGNKRWHLSDLLHAAMDAGARPVASSSADGYIQMKVRA